MLSAAKHLLDASEILRSAQDDISARQDDISARCANVFLHRGVQKRNQATMKATWLIGCSEYADIAALSVGTRIRRDTFAPKPFDITSSATERDSQF
jgi:hypothetical protein